jgi:hypothetical protein
MDMNLPLIVKGKKLEMFHQGTFSLFSTKRTRISKDMGLCFVVSFMDELLNIF